MRNIKAGICQAAFTQNKSENLKRAERLIRACAELGASLVVLPEMACWWGPLSRMPEQAESLSGPWVTRMRQLAGEIGIWLVAGTFPRKKKISGKTRGKAWNSTPIINPKGKVAGVADKCHLFDVNVPGGPSVRESEAFKPGQKPFRLQTPFGALGFGICYDARFPEMFRAIVKMGGMDILIILSAFHRETGKAHWETLLRARAIENQCFVIGANQCGKSSHGYESYGHSMAVGPWGETLLRLGADEAIGVAELNADTLVSIRRNLPALTHIRKNYGI